MEFVQLNPRQVEKHYCLLPNFVDEDGVVLSKNNDGFQYISVSKLSIQTGQIYFLVSFVSLATNNQKFILFVLKNSFKVTWHYLYKLFMTEKSYSLRECIDISLLTKNSLLNILANVSKELR